MKKVKVILCITTFAVMALIFFFSSQNSDQSTILSNGVTKRIVSFLGDIFKWTKEKQDTVISELHGHIRKTAHFTIYAALGMSTVIACKAIKACSFKYASLCTVLFCCAYAVTDEFHQMFTAGRTPLVKDVCIDTLGSTVGVLVVWIVYVKYVKRKSKLRLTAE